MGSVQVTTQNLEIVRVDAENNFTADKRVLSQEQRKLSSQ